MSSKVSLSLLRCQVELAPAFVGQPLKQAATRQVQGIRNQLLWGRGAANVLRATARFLNLQGVGR